MATIAIKGMDVLERKLKELEASVRSDVAERALNKAGAVVAEEAKARAPVGRSGKGRESIGHHYHMSDGYPAVSVGIHPGLRASAKDGFYLKFFETGTGPRQTKKGANRGGNPMRPWLRPALDQSVGRVREVVIAEVDAEIRRHAE